jgi:putative autotransporter adhesin-like protein
MKPINQTSHKLISRELQKLLAVVFVLVLFMTTKAGTGPGIVQVVDYKEISNGQAVERIEVRGDVSIVLTNALGTNIMLEGNNKDIALVKTTVKNGTLEINAEKKKTLSRLTVYLTVNDIHSLIVTGNAEISSSGISVNNLDIILNGDSFVQVQHQGKLRIIPGAGYEVADVTAGKFVHSTDR